MIKKGDKFLLIDHTGNGWNVNGYMDCYISKIVTVERSIGYQFVIIEDNKSKVSKICNGDKWIFDGEDVQKKVEI